MKIKGLLLSCAFVSFFTLSVIEGPKANASPNYPRSSEQAKAGDVLKCGKGLDTFFVGHVGILGEGLDVHHCLPGNDPGVTESLSSFIRSFTQYGTVDVYRYSPGRGQLMGPFLQPLQAARWADRNINAVKEYNLANFRMGDVSRNYCSKFVWQSYYLGANTCIEKCYSGRAMHSNSLDIFPVSSIDFSNLFQRVTNID